MQHGRGEDGTPPVRVPSYPIYCCQYSVIDYYSSSSSSFCHPIPFVKMACRSSTLSCYVAPQRECWNELLLLSFSLLYYVSLKWRRATTFRRIPQWSPDKRCVATSQHQRDMRKIMGRRWTGYKCRTQTEKNAHKSSIINRAFVGYVVGPCAIFLHLTAKREMGQGGRRQLWKAREGTFKDVALQCSFPAI